MFNDVLSLIALKIVAILFLHIKMKSDANNFSAVRFTTVQQNHHRYKLYLLLFISFF